MLSPEALTLKESVLDHTYLVVNLSYMPETRIGAAPPGWYGGLALALLNACLSIFKFGYEVTRRHI